MKMIMFRYQHIPKLHKTCVPLESKHGFVEECITHKIVQGGYTVIQAPVHHNNLRNDRWDWHMTPTLTP